MIIALLLAAATQAPPVIDLSKSESISLYAKRLDLQETFKAMNDEQNEVSRELEKLPAYQALKKNQDKVSVQVNEINAEAGRIIRLHHLDGKVSYDLKSDRFLPIQPLEEKKK